MARQLFLFLALVQIEAAEPLTEEQAADYLNGLLLPFPAEADLVELQAFELGRVPREP